MQWVYLLMVVVDEKNWTEKKEVGNDSISKFASHFATTLSIAGYKNKGLDYMEDASKICQHLL